MCVGSDAEYYALRRLRPLARRRRRIACPARVRDLARNPMRRLRTRVLGWKVRFIGLRLRFDVLQGLEHASGLSLAQNPAVGNLTLQRVFLRPLLKNERVRGINTRVRVIQTLPSSNF